MKDKAFAASVNRDCIRQCSEQRGKGRPAESRLLIDSTEQTNEFWE